MHGHKSLIIIQNQSPSSTRKPAQPMGESQVYLVGDKLVKWWPDHHESAYGLSVNPAQSEPMPTRSNLRASTAEFGKQNSQKYGFCYGKAQVSLKHRAQSLLS